MTLEEKVAFGASDHACYLYPGEDQQKERMAFCEGAVFSATGVVELRSAIAKLLPSNAGGQNQPNSKIIAFYMSLGELRALTQLAKGSE